MTYLLDGGKDETTCRELVMKQLDEDPAFADGGLRYDLARPECRVRTFERVAAVWKYFMADASNLSMRNARVDLFSQWDPSWATRNGVHFGLFMGAVTGQGSEEQVAEWLPQCLMMKIYGCYGMTELGHGSFVRGIETTATYDAAKQEFVINSPTDTSTKASARVQASE
jgi:acyl-CoA oxidase